MNLNRAFTPEQKREIIERLLQCWLASPAERLGQLILNSVDEERLYYVEDATLAAMLERRA